MSEWHPTPCTTRAERADRGFSLPELLTVLVVLGTLAAVVTTSVRHMRTSAEESACQTERRAVERATALWRKGSTEVPTVDDLVAAELLRSRPGRYTLDDAGAVTLLATDACPSGSPPIDMAAGPGDGTGSGDNGSGGNGEPGAGGNGAGGNGAGVGTGDAAIDGGTVVDPADEQVEFTLTWTGNADLDVWVRSPAGELVGWLAASDGAARLDLDVVPPAPDAVGPHVERIVWPAATAPPGEYVAWAHFQSVGWGSQVDSGFVLTARRGGRTVATMSGAIGAPGSRSDTLLAAIA